MSWARIDDQFHCHPKIVGLSLAAVGLQALALSYCGDTLTDGRVPSGWARKQAPAEVIEELTAEGVWEQHENDRDWQIHDYLDYNFSREEVEAKHEERAAAGRRGAAARWGTDGSSHSSRHSSAIAT